MPPFICLLGKKKVQGGGSPAGSDGKESACNQETWVSSLCPKDPLEEEVETTPVFLPGEKFHGQRNLGAVTAHGVAESQTQLSD